MFTEAVRDWSTKRIGKNGRADKMSAFADYLSRELVAAGIPQEDIFYSGKRSKNGILTLPGYYRVSKAWDFVVCKNSNNKNTPPRR